MLSGGLSNVGKRTPNVAARGGEMLSRLARAREHWTADEPQDDEPEISSSLFECDTCDVVYIDTAKHTCPKCDNEVEEVRKTLRPEDGAD